MIMPAKSESLFFLTVTEFPEVAMMLKSEFVKKA